MTNIIINIKEINMLDKLFDYRCAKFINNDTQCILFKPTKIMQLFKVYVLKNIKTGQLSFRPMNNIVDGSLYSVILQDITINCTKESIDNTDQLIDIEDKYMDIFQYFKIRQYKFKN